MRKETRFAVLLLAAACPVNSIGQDFSFVLNCSYNDGQERDLLTYGCLLGHEDHSEPAWCAEFDPGYGAQARDAHRNWLSRNRDVLKEIQSACDARLLRAYSNDQTAIATAREAAKRRDKKDKEEMKAQYWSGSQPHHNCSSYVHQMKEGKDEAKALTAVVQAIRDCRARPVQ
jgi:hypothetical protein